MVLFMDNIWNPHVPGETYPVRYAGRGILISW
nr:MAG TPA: ribosome synthesis, antimalarial drug, RIBOSOME [Caudoviricetes sp.]